jgi:hypothetical protein
VANYTCDKIPDELMSGYNVGAATLTDNNFLIIGMYDDKGSNAGDQAMENHLTYIFSAPDMILVNQIQNSGRVSLWKYANLVFIAERIKSANDKWITRKGKATA